MSEHTQDEENKDNSSESEYKFHWNYGEQVVFDRENDRRKRKKGLRSYAIAMTAVFLVCITILVGVVIWYGDGGHGNIYAVAQGVSPATVIVFQEGSENASYGTGFIVYSDGYIVTNYHVVSKNGRIKVTLYTGQTLEAEYIDGSEVDDLAVLKINGSGYPTVTIGNSDRVKTGDSVIAIGNPSGPEAAWTVTEGIVSASRRALSRAGYGYTAQTTMIQTDAALNPGNSGGPLCNESGEVIGVVTSKLKDYEGISFAIPINEAMETVNALIEGTFEQSASSVSKITPALGINAVDIKAGTVFRADSRNYTAQYDGIRITKVLSEGCSSFSIVENDIIFEINGKKIADSEQLKVFLAECKLGDMLKVKLQRKGTILNVDIQLGKEL